ncbi:MAG: hypothetical protein JKY22_12030 [Flavobacteriaceae bacterium]|nr:hypothetical protein [Flavobacteriaceae bacterium]PCJ26478.1 MAG: hypothetical protein COA94_05055 [Rickettsiales bacterium]
MADNIELSTGSGGATVKTDDDGSAHWQYVKVSFGADNTQTRVTSSVGLPVDILAGTATIGEVTIGAATGAAGDLAKAEDAVHGSGDIGVMSLAVRNDTLAALAGTDGDYAPFQVNATGALYIQEGAALDVSAATLTVNAHAVTNAGTFVVQEDGAALTALQLLDDAVATLGTTTYTETTTKGNVIGAVRNDTLAALAGTDNEIAPFQVNASGALYIQEGAAMDVSAATLTVNAHAVTNAGTFVVQEDGAALTALQLIDNIVHVDDAAFTLGTHSGVMMMGFAGTQSVNANDAGAIAMETDGAVHIHDGGNSITVDGTVTANPASGTIDTVTTVTAVTDITNTIDSTISGAALTALQLIDDPVFADSAAFTLGSSKVNVQGGVFQSGTPTALTDNDAGAVLLNSTAGQMVELMASTAVIGSVINAGTFATQNTAQASTNTQEMVGDVAHDAAAAGNPVLIGSRATAAIEALTEVAEADASYIATDLQGAIITRSYCTAQEQVEFYIGNTDGAEDAVTGLDAGGAGVHNYVTSIIVHNAHASTNGFVTLLDGSGGSISAVFPAPATGGVVHRFDPPWKQPTANTALFVDVSAAITTMHITISGFQGQG